MTTGFLNNGLKSECYGCEACVQVCPTRALIMQEDDDGFRYPILNINKCLKCNRCHKVCPAEYPTKKKILFQKFYGGYIKNKKILQNSTSGGIFTAIVNSFCDKNYIIFGAQSNGLEVEHSFTTNKNDIQKFRKSKYAQSKILDSYINVRKFLEENKKVIFSGTPCQISGLYNFLGNKKYKNLLTIDVVCEGIPSPLLLKKYNDFLYKKYKSKIRKIDYRNKDNPRKWDFEVMKIYLENGRQLKIDRWKNPFWSLWINHLVSRPSCLNCKFSSLNRVGDITLGDLWGTHIFKPCLYNNNRGSSLYIINKKLNLELNNVILEELPKNEVLKYQSSLRNRNIIPSGNTAINDLKNSKLSLKSLEAKYKCKNDFLFFLNKYTFNRLSKQIKYRTSKLKNFIFKHRT